MPGNPDRRCIAKTLLQTGCADIVSTLVDPICLRNEAPTCPCHPCAEYHRWAVVLAVFSKKVLRERSSSRPLSSRQGQPYLHYLCRQRNRRELRRKPRRPPNPRTGQQRSDIISPQSCGGSFGPLCSCLVRLESAESADVSGFGQSFPRVIVQFPP
jgi:hypothetical protein